MVREVNNGCFTTLWNYTILKPTWFYGYNAEGFTTLWNYTILKQGSGYKKQTTVLLPYGITLFSNAYQLV